MEKIKQAWADRNQVRDLSVREKKVLALLGLPTFGLALSLTAVVTYVPLLAKEFTNSTIIVGLVIATEGIVALTLPVLVGSKSDNLHTRIGGRLPFILIGAPLAAASIFALGFVDNIWLLVVCVMIFFFAYYLAYEPYRALYPDLVKDDAAARAQSAQAVWRGVGTGIALAIGGYLFAVDKRLTFASAAIISLSASLLFVWILLKKYGVPHQHRQEPHSLKDSYKIALGHLRKNPRLLNFMIANTLWELTLAALKCFILLYLTVGIGHSQVEAATIVTVTAVIIFLAAPLSGKLADTFGKVKVMRIAAIVFGIGLLVPVFTSNSTLHLAILPIVAFGGAVLLTLPYALLIPMMSKGEYGRLTGLYSTSRGIGIMLGPLIAGASISLTKNTFLAHGYSAMWLVCGVSMLLSVIFINSLGNSE